MTGLQRWLDRRWDALEPQARVDATGVLLAAAIYLVHFAVLAWWYVEDAAITFSFARNLVAGEGLVAVPGGERVEGFSNPTWTLLLAPFDLVGANPFIAAKWLGAAFGLLTLPLALRWARHVLPPERGAFASLAPILLALCPQFVIWNASGLENSLFVVLLAAGVVWMLDEVELGGRPWSAIPLVLLAITRPEAPLYAFVIGVWGFGAHLVRRPRDLARWTLQFAALFLPPFALWHAWRITWFGWPLPNTYYAKLADMGKFEPFGWNVAGWKYLRGYALDSGQGFLVPIYALGMTGIRGWRPAVLVPLGIVTVTLVIPGLGWLGFLPHWPLVSPEPPLLVESRITVLVAAAVALPILGLGRPAASPRILAWVLTGVSLFFVVYSGGDWMKGYRWLSMATVPMAVLLTDALWSVGEAVAARWSWGRATDLAVGSVALVPILVGVGQTVDFLGGPETMPYDVRRRVLYMQGVADRLELDHVTLMDVDMGAHMWWSGFELVDMAGLIDVPMAHHKWEKPFVHQYVYEEKRPEFAHVHGSWEKRTRMTTHKEWKQYVEIDPYPVSPWVTHPGCNVRKDLFIDSSWEGGLERRVEYTDGLQLAGLDVPQPTVAAGQSLYVELGWRRDTGRSRPFRALLFLSGQGHLVVRDLPPAYDWVPPTQWHAHDVLLGRHSVPLPDDLPPGTYDLGMLVLGADGIPLGVEDLGTAVNGDPAFAAGEVRWTGAVTVVPLDDAIQRADDGVTHAIATSEADDCDGAESAWRIARRGLDKHDPWQATAHARLDGPLARCWARAAGNASGADQVAKIAAARRWDHDDADVLAAAAHIADSLEASGEAAWQAGDVDTAYADWRDALIAEPTRSKLRRKAENARDRSLGIDAEDEPPPALDGGGG
jgi:hypothetical protein